jgi:hypothetical protein
MCSCIYILPTIARQRLDKHVPAATSTCNNRIAGRVVLYAVRVISISSTGNFLLLLSFQLCLGHLGDFSLRFLYKNPVKQPKKIPLLQWNSKVHYRLHISLGLIPALWAR